jgi:hypothetical protein
MQTAFATRVFFAVVVAAVVGAQAEMPVPRNSRPRRDCSGGLQGRRVFSALRAAKCASAGAEPTKFSRGQRLDLGGLTYVGGHACFSEF